MWRPFKGKNPENRVKFGWLYVVMFCVAIACLLGSELFESSDGYIPVLKSYKTYEELTKELGYAFLISIVISLTLEATAKKAQVSELKEHIVSVNRNVFGGIFGVFLPQGIIKEFIDIIVGSKFVRSAYILRADLNIINVAVEQRNLDIVEMSLRVSYKIKNTTPNLEEYNIVIEVDDPPRFQGWPKDRIDTVFVDSIKITQDPTRHSGVGSLPAEKKTLNFLYPVALSSNQEISVTIHTKLFRGMSDSEVFFSSVPCMDLRLEVHRCEKLARIGASAIHRAELQLESESSDGREMVWALRSAVLPAQGVYVWWRNE